MIMFRLKRKRIQTANDEPTGTTDIKWGSVGEVVFLNDEEGVMGMVRKTVKVSDPPTV